MPLTTRVVAGAGSVVTISMKMAALSSPTMTFTSAVSTLIELVKVAIYASALRVVSNNPTKVMRSIEIAGVPGPMSRCITAS